MLDVSLLCVAKNESIYLKKSIESIIKHVKEVIFIDHYSIDNTYAIAEELELRYENFKIIRIEKQDNLSHAEVREMCKNHASTEYVFKYDADIVFVNDGINKLEVGINYLQTHPRCSGVAYYHVNLFLDTNHIVDGAAEVYLFRKSAYVYDGTGVVNDQQNLVNTNYYVHNSNEVIFVHANNVKPLLNILFRVRMSEYKTLKTHKLEEYELTKGLNYFEWLYWKQNGKFSNGKEIITFIINQLKYLLKNSKVPSDVRSIKGTDYEEYFAEIKDFSVKQEGDVVHYERYIIMIHGNQTIHLDDEWERKAYLSLEEAYEKGDIDKFY
jgi:glycosyltransferase involved in cell wall biosynthesis